MGSALKTGGVTPEDIQRELRVEHCFFASKDPRVDPEFAGGNISHLAGNVCEIAQEDLENTAGERDRQWMDGSFCNFH